MFSSIPTVRQTRRRVLGLLGAFPVALCGVPGTAQPRRLELASYIHGEAASLEAAQLLADRAAEASRGTLRFSLEVIPPGMPLEMMSTASALAHYCAAEFAAVEPVLGFPALPLLTTTFDEAEILLRIARPYYAAALARHGQILLATQPWRPVALWSTFRIRSAADLHGSAFLISPPVGERAGWGRTLVRAGSRRASFSDAEMLLSGGYTLNVKYTQEFAFLTEIFVASPLNFLTMSRTVFEALTEAERRILVATGREIELSEWEIQRERRYREHNEIRARGVSVALHAPGDVLPTLQAAAEPEIQNWVDTAGEDGITILGEYRRAIGWHRSGRRADPVRRSLGTRVRRAFAQTR
jgi:hypothetical protein